MKYNAVIMLKEILKHTNKYLNDDVKECYLEHVLFFFLFVRCQRKKCSFLFYLNDDVKEFI